MQFPNKIKIVALVLPLAIGLGGCSSTMIGVHEGSERVSIADASQVSACQSKGSTIFSVLAQVGILTRHTEDVEANLYQLARNEAAATGADTLVKGESPELGKRAYALYKCRP